MSHPPSCRLVVFTDGPSHGGISNHTTDKARLVDIWLDYRDAANEDADGLLPHQRADEYAGMAA